jgi:long-chain acyl-CoA synthetase
MKSNRATWFELMSMAQELRAQPESVYVANMPMFHISCNVGLAMVMVGSLHLQTRRFDVDEFLDLVDRRGVTHAQLVPAMIQAVLERWDGRPPTIESVMYGGSPMPVSVAQRALATWPGCRFINTFGLTEAMGVTMLSPEEHDPDGAPELLRSVGRSAPFMTWRVVDDDDREVPDGTVGEVITTGPNLLTGYWQNPEATASALRGGWFHTGDLGYRDEDGYLFLVDRRNDRIITGGENVYPSEVEQVILTHASVADVAVFGLPDERWGEAVSAAVVLAPGAELTSGEVVAHCRAHLAGYKVPKRVLFEPGLPRSPTGKVLRRVLREASERV